MALQQKKLKLTDNDDLGGDGVNGSKPNVENAEPTKITDLNEYCLEKIFMHLDVESLFSVANSNKWLQDSAASVYGRKFSKNPVNLCSIRKCNASLYMFGEYICVDSLKFSLAFLRCFGAKIPGIILFCRRAFARASDEYINRYMNQYCADTLTAIHVTESSTFSNEIFAKPFTKLASVDFFGTNFALNFRNLVNWFPMVQHLKISACSMNYSSINEHFPHLEHLTIPIANSGWDNVVNLLSLNPQLNHLEADLAEDVNKTANDLLDMIGGNAAISKLTVKGSGDAYVNVNAAEVQRFANEHPLMAELVLSKYVFNVGDIITLIGRLNALKRFQFRFNERTEYNELVSRLSQEWQHNLGYVINLTTKQKHFSVELTR